MPFRTVFAATLGHTRALREGVIVVVVVVVGLTIGWSAFGSTTRAGKDFFWIFLHFWKFLGSSLLSCSDLSLATASSFPLIFFGFDLFLPLNIMVN